MAGNYYTGPRYDPNRYHPTNNELRWSPQYKQWGLYAGDQWRQESCEDKVSREIYNSTKRIRDEIMRLEREKLSLQGQTGGGEYQRSFRLQQIERDLGAARAQLQQAEIDKQNRIDECNKRRTVEDRQPEVFGGGWDKPYHPFFTSPGSNDRDQDLLGLFMGGA